jgi:hypothetical protein
MRFVSYCPRCQAELKSLEGQKLLEAFEGYQLVWCEKCDMFAFADDFRWFKGSSEVVIEALKERQADLQRELDAFEGSLRDPRWVGVGM